MKCPCCGSPTDKLKEFAFVGDCVFWAGKQIHMFPRVAQVLAVLWEKRDHKDPVPGSKLTPDAVKPNSISVYVHMLRQILREEEIPYAVESGPLGTASFKLKKLNGAKK
jgi:hypothetical protein